MFRQARFALQERKPALVARSDRALRGAVETASVPHECNPAPTHASPCGYRRDHGAPFWRQAPDFFNEHFKQTDSILRTLIPTRTAEKGVRGNDTTATVNTNQSSTGTINREDRHQTAIRDSQAQALSRKTEEGKGKQTEVTNPAVAQIKESMGSVSLILKTKQPLWV